jgi:AraC-like DNA-binding protein
MLLACGLRLEEVESRQHRVPAQKQVRFLDRVAARLGDELLGLHLAARFEPREAGLLYFVMASSETLGEALRRVERYTCLVSDGVRLTRLRGDETGLECAYVGLSRSADRQLVEFCLGAIARIAQQLTGSRIRPARVSVMHPPANKRKEAEAIFGCSIEYAAEADQIGYEPSAAEAPLRDADPYLNEILVRFCEEARARMVDQVGSLRMRVENAIGPALPHGKATLPDIARRLGLTTRSLSRGLAAERASFSEVLKALRLDLAKRYLRSSDLPVGEIAWLLGFKDSTAFTHFYRRLVGHAPSRERGRSELAPKAFLDPKAPETARRL